MIIGIDFDGTCVTHEFPATGKEIGAEPVLKELVEEGHKLILNTVRSNVHGGKNPGPHLDNAVAWFTEKNIPLFGVNENPQQKYWSTSPKAYCHLYIDDAALGIPLLLVESVSERPFVDWTRVREMLVEREVL